MYLAIGMPGGPELLLILLLVLIVFGVGKLPQVLGQMGKGVRAFKDGMQDGDQEMKEIMAEADVSDAQEVASPSATTKTDA